jgi:hypothetical protein
MKSTGGRIIIIIIMNLSHSLLSATRILLVPFLHVLFTEDLISGGLALGLVTCGGFC